MKKNQKSRRSEVIYRIKNEVKKSKILDYLNFYFRQKIECLEEFVLDYFYN